MRAVVLALELARSAGSMNIQGGGPLRGFGACGVIRLLSALQGYAGTVAQTRVQAHESQQQLWSSCRLVQVT